MLLSRQVICLKSVAKTSETFQSRGYHSRRFTCDHPAVRRDISVKTYERSLLSLSQHSEQRTTRTPSKKARLSEHLQHKWLYAHISVQCASSKLTNSCCGLGFFSFFFSLVLRRCNDFMRVASLPRGAVSDLGLGSGCVLSPYSCVFGTDAEAATTVVGDVAAASSAPTSIRAWASACLRSASSSLLT